MSNWQEKQLTAIADGAVKAIERTRFILLVTNFACIIMSVAIWNAQLSWSATTERPRLLKALKECMAQMPDTTPDQWGVRKEPVDWRPAVEASELVKHKAHCHEVDIAFDTVTKMNFGDYNSVSVPVIGLQIDTNDVALWGSLALLVLGTWEWFAVRRENHATRDVLVAMRAANDPEIGAYLYRTVGVAFMFLTSSSDDVPPWHLTAASGARTGWLVRWPGPSRLPRSVFFVLQLLPVLTIGFALSVEIWAYHRESWIQPNTVLWNALMQDYAAQTWFRLAFAVVSLLLLGFMTWGRMAWTSSTSSMLGAMTEEYARTWTSG